MSTKKLSQCQFIERCKHFHGDKYDYTEAEYQGMSKKIKVRCNKCNTQWQVTPGNHLGPRKSGCPECKRIAQIGRDAKGQQQFITEVRKIHGDRYDLSKTVYKTSNSKVLVVCCEHGEFTKWPNDLRNGSGCPRCGNSWKKSHAEFISEMAVKRPDIIVHGQYVNAKRAIEVECKTHKYRYSTPPNYLLMNGNSCPDCTRNRMIKTKEAAGQISPQHLKSKYERYRRDVWAHSNRTYKALWSHISRDCATHLDHIVSIVEGFREGVPPEVMGSEHNLRLIPAKENRQKSYKSTMEVATLLKLFKDSSPI